MKGTKKSRPGDCSTRTAAETAAFDGAAVPFVDSNINDGRGQTGIASLLMHGQQNAIPLRQLKQMTSLPGRELRRRIQAERLAGTPILSDNQHGYFLPESDFGRRRFVQSMKGRAREIQAVAAAVERTVIE